MRALDDSISRVAYSIKTASPNWKRNLDAFDVQFAVIPLVSNETGEAVPLAFVLAEDADWSVIYLQNNSAIFVRDKPENHALIYRFNTDKKKVYREILAVVNAFLKHRPDDARYNMTKAYALLALGRIEEARGILEKFPPEGGPLLESLENPAP